MNSVNTRNTNINSQLSTWFPNRVPNKINNLCLTKGVGYKIYDVHGKEYIDLASGLWNVMLGYSNTHIKNAINSQMNKLVFSSLFENSNDLLLTSSHKLINFLGLKKYKAVFTCSGSESNEVAIKLMRGYWSLKGKSDKKIILSFSDSYHGTSYGAMSISDVEKIQFEHITPMLDLTSTITPMYSCNECKDCKRELELRDKLENLEQFLEKNNRFIAGIIIEPILASKGVVSICNNYLKSIVELFKRYNILIAFDEVATGFYRCGYRFYFKKLGFIPDIVCMSKAINSGYLPLGATVVSDDIVNTYNINDELLPHGSTQGGNLLSIAAMNSCLNQYLDLEKKYDLKEKGDIFLEILRKKLSNLNCIKNIRGEGYFYSIDLIHNDSINYIIKIKDFLEYNGIVVYYSEYGLSLLPMIIIETDEWIEIVNKIYNILVKI